MIFYPLSANEDKQCGFELWKDGGMTCCGEPAVVECSIPLCREHASYAIAMTRAILKPKKGARQACPATEFWENVELNVRERKRQLLLAEERKYGTDPR